MQENNENKTLDIEWTNLLNLWSSKSAELLQKEISAKSYELSVDPVFCIQRAVFTSSADGQIPSQPNKKTKALGQLLKQGAHHY
jgi:hypothetical protein